MHFLAGVFRPPNTRKKGIRKTRESEPKNLWKTLPNLESVFGHSFGLLSICRGARGSLFFQVFKMSLKS